MTERTEQVETRYVIVYADAWECGYDSEAQARASFIRDARLATLDSDEPEPVRLEHRTTRTITECVVLEGA